MSVYYYSQAGSDAPYLECRDDGTIVAHTPPLWRETCAAFDRLAELLAGMVAPAPADAPGKEG